MSILFIEKLETITFFLAISLVNKNRKTPPNLSNKLTLLVSELFPKITQMTKTRETIYIGHNKCIKYIIGKRLKLFALVVLGKVN